MKQAVGVLMIPVELITPINGVDIPQFEKMSGGLRFLQGGPPQSPDDLSWTNITRGKTSCTSARPLSY